MFGVLKLLFSFSAPKISLLPVYNVLPHLLEACKITLKPNKIRIRFKCGLFSLLGSGNGKGRTQQGTTSLNVLYLAFKMNLKHRHTSLFQLLHYLVRQKYVRKRKGGVKMRTTVLKMRIICKQKFDRRVWELWIAECALFRLKLK